MNQSTNEGENPQYRSGEQIMPKKGLQQPWKCEYLWEDSRSRGKTSHYDQEAAERQARQIREAAAQQGRPVTVEVYRVEVRR